MVRNGECPGRIKKGAAEASGDLRGLRVSTAWDLHQMRLRLKGENVVARGKVPDWALVGLYLKNNVFLYHWAMRLTIER